MIRVGFVNVFAVRGWLGGLNYLRNLLQAVVGLEARRIEPVLFAGRSIEPSIAAEFGFLQMVRTRALDRGDPVWLVRKALQRTTGGDPLLRSVLRRHGISILSHSGDLGRGASIPALSWVPDLQHRGLPHLFSAAQIAERESQIARALERCACMIVSSEAVSRDLAAASPAHAGKIRVLRFVSGLSGAGTLPGEQELRARHGIEGRYLLLPNQFWAHKNHGIIVAALERLQASGRHVTVVATGLMEDPRQPAHVDALMRRVRDAGLGPKFRTPGVIAYADMLGLMRHAVAVVNPSLFEGWSTSVEEAKSMGKAVVLSDIAVHREQAPARAHFFDPNDAQAAADALWAAWDGFDASAERQAAWKAAEELPGRRRAFATTYQDIVLEASHARPVAGT